MKAGDLVKITDVGPEDTRGIGTILSFGTWDCQRAYPSVIESWRTHDDEAIIEVLWSDAHVGWVLRRRVEVLNEIR